MNANQREAARADMLNMIKWKGTATVGECMTVFRRHYTSAICRGARLDALLAGMETDGLIACHYTESGRVLSAKARR